MAKANQLAKKQSKLHGSKHNHAKLPGYNIPASTIIQCKALLRMGVKYIDIQAKLNLSEQTIAKISKDEITFKGATAEDVSAAEEMFAVTSLSNQQILSEKIMSKALLDDGTIPIDKLAYTATQMAICREKAQGKQAKTNNSQITIVLQIARQRADVSSLIAAGFSDAVVVDVQDKP